MYDDVLRSNTTALTATETGASADVGVDLAPRTIMVNVPAAPTGTTPTLDIKIQESDDGSAWRDYAAFPQITAAGQQFITTKSNARYRRAVLTVGGTTPNFGNVLVAYVPAGRSTNW